MEMIEVKTEDLIGRSLNWAVAKAEEMGPFILSRGMYFGTVVTVGDDKTWSPSINWSQGGPLIEQYKVCVDYQGGGVFDCLIRDFGRTTRFRGFGILIPAMRAIVHAKLGAIASVPKELMQ